MFTEIWSLPTISMHYSDNNHCIFQAMPPWLKPRNSCFVPVEKTLSFQSRFEQILIAFDSIVIHIQTVERIAWIAPFWQHQHNSQAMAFRISLTGHFVCWNISLSHMNMFLSDISITECHTQASFFHHFVWSSFDFFEHYGDFHQMWYVRMSVAIKLLPEISVNQHDQHKKVNLTPFDSL